MPRYIDADKAEKDFEETFCKHCNSYDRAKCRACDMKDGADIFNDAPTEDVQPVVHAHWKEISRVRHIGKCNLPISRCSCCNFEFCDIINTNELYNFCPYCGAKMDEKEERYVRDIFVTR